MSRTIDSLKDYIDFLKNPNRTTIKYITPGAKTDYGFDNFVYGICGVNPPTDSQFRSLLNKIGDIDSDLLHNSITDSVVKNRGNNLRTLLGDELSWVRIIYDTIP